MSKAVKIQKQTNKKEKRRSSRTTCTGAKIMSHVSAKKEYTFHSYTYFLQGSFALSKQQLYDNRSSQKQQQGERERE